MTPGTRGRELGMRPFAQMLGLGRKSQSSVADFEHGRRIPADYLIEKYAGLPGADPEQLKRLVTAAEQDAETAVRPGTPGAISGRRSRSATSDRRPAVRRWMLGVGIAVVVGGVVTVLLLRSGRSGQSDALHVELSRPSGVVSALTDVVGSVSQRGNQDLWVDVQVISDPEHHHPAQQPCSVDASGRFTFSPLYVGAAADRGKQFRVTIVAVVNGGSAEQALIEYGKRDTALPDAYVGMTSLPPGATVVAEQVVTRG